MIAQKVQYKIRENREDLKIIIEILKEHKGYWLNIQNCAYIYEIYFTKLIPDTNVFKTHKDNI